MNILYMPIYEPGSYHARSRANKHGLRDALSRYGSVLDWDYLSNDRATAYEGLCIRMEQHTPDLVFAQLGSVEHFTGEQIRELRQRYPNTRWFNWNGDYWLDPMVTPQMLDLLQAFDMQLVVNASVLPIYAEYGIHAAYLCFVFLVIPLSYSASSLRVFFYPYSSAFFISIRIAIISFP